MTEQGTRPQQGLSRRAFLKVAGAGLGAAALVCAGTQALPAQPLPVVKKLNKTFGGNLMDKKILLAYASRYGSTVEVAERIAGVLAEQGMAVDLKPIEETPALNAGDYQGVVLGSAVQHGAWLPEASAWVQANSAALKTTPTALFCVHITNLGSDPQQTALREAYLDPLRLLVNLKAQAFFPGRFDRFAAREMVPLWLSRLIPTLDFRKWKRIESWSTLLPAVMKLS